ncbi:hypothetical protein D3C72_1880180 [compost metagenome]
MIGTGFRNCACSGTFFSPPFQVWAPATFWPLASATAAAAASRPRSRASFQTDTVCEPCATRLSAAWSPSWPDTGMPLMPLAVSAATTPPAVPSLEATTASILPPLLVMICSMFFCATSGFQPSVYSSPTILMSPLVMAASITSCCPARRKLALGSVGDPLIIT